MTSAHLLLLAPSSTSTDRLAKALGEAGYQVERMAESKGAEGLACGADVDVLLSGIQPDTENLLREALHLPEGPEIILFEDFGEVTAAFEEVRRAAFDTLARPVSDDEVLRVVERALEHRNILADNRRLRSELGERFELGSLESRSPRMGRIFRLVESVADSGVGLLLEGESGTGKTMLARAIHARSSRSGEPFVGVNCGAIPDSLLESELFGHVRGAFTGAVRDRAGKFEAAGDGTLFLDEIGTASPDLQVKLLRVLEEGLYERVGESTTRTTHARVIAATNAKLEVEVQEGRFRADLYYRLNVVGILVPPLRERIPDIPLLAQSFLEAFSRRYSRGQLAFAPDVSQALCTHPWPGNVRELENRIERAVLLTQGERIDVLDLWPASDGDRAAPHGRLEASDPAVPEAGEQPLPAEAPGLGGEGPLPRLAELPIGPLKESLARVETWLVRRALHFHLGNRTHTARALGINRTTLFNKMRRYDLLDFPSGCEGE